MYSDYSLDALIETAKNEFKKKFDQEPEICSYAPGRINLIGDHTDYNDGFVLPMTIPKFTVIVGSKTTKKYSTIDTLLSKFKDTQEQIIELDKIEKSNNCSWINYIIGVVDFFH